MFSTQVEDSSAILKFAVLMHPVDGDFMRRLQRLGKRVHGKSARQVAEVLGVTRATFKAWETGKKRITDDKADAAQRIYKLWSADVAAEQSETRSKTRDLIQIKFSKGCDARMRRLKISHKPKKCRVCGDWFEPASSRQKRCSECVRDASKAAKSKRRRSK